MKRKIKTTVIVLCAALAFSVICGCGEEKQNVSVDQPVQEEEDGKGDLITDENQFADSKWEPRRATAVSKT